MFKKIAIMHKKGEFFKIKGSYLQHSGHILDLYCVRLSNAASFRENYAKLYFDAKHSEKGLNRGAVKFWGPFFQKKCPFSPILNAALNF